MNASVKPNRIARIAALAAAPIIALALSASAADASPRGGNGHKHGHGHGHGRHDRHARVVRHVAAPCQACRVVVRQPVSTYRVYAPYTTYAPYPVYRTYPVYPAPLPYGSVVYDRRHDRVDGFVSFSGPNFSLGVGF